MASDILENEKTLGMRLLTDFYFTRVCVVTDDASKQQRSYEVREYNRKANLGPSGFRLKTENMNGELFVNELIICFVDLSTELQIGESYLPFAPAHQ